ncbi:MAG: hypothetical protein WCQ21_26015 [Verrucomicrobiota bacterium]
MKYRPKLRSASPQRKLLLFLHEHDAGLVELARTLAVRKVLL